MLKRTLILASLLALIFAFTGCGDDDNPTKGGSNNTTVTLKFVGTVNGDNGSLTASLVLNVNGTTVTGTLHITAPADNSIALTGTYNTATKALTSSGSGYTFDGTFDGSNVMEGTMSGTASGTFLTVKDDNNTAVAFCGSFTGDDDGVWNFTLDGTTIAGSYTTSTGTVGALDGTISGNTITINRPGGGTLATGTRSGDNASGTWDNGLGSNGTWTGSKCN